MRLKEFLDPEKVMQDIVKGFNIDPGLKRDLLKGTTWEKPEVKGATQPSGKSVKQTRPRQDISTAKSRSEPSTNKSKVTRNIVSPGSIKNYILSKGLSKNHAAGMLTNIKAESGFNSAAYNPNDLGARSIGFFQHRAGRANALEKAVPDWRTNWQGQVDFALSEPEGQQYAKLNFRSPQEASKWFTTYFERPQNTNRQAIARAATATQYV